MGHLQHKVSRRCYNTHVSEAQPQSSTLSSGQYLALLRLMQSSCVLSKYPALSAGVCELVPSLLAFRLWPEPQPHNIL